MTSFVTGLQCRECGRPYPKAPLSVCEYCFGPLEVNYNYVAAKTALSQAIIERRPPNMWRYHELLPVDGEASVGGQVGFTPLVRARNLGKRLGIRELYVKNDSVCFPTLSFKDRVVSIAITMARAFGFEAVSCASTGNLANATAAHAAKAGMDCYVFVPDDLERAKILSTEAYGAKVVLVNGNYDDVNRLCSEVAEALPWAFVNVNMRPYYAEGSKSLGFETAEQLGWRLPDHVVVPIASGALLTKIHRAFSELIAIGAVATDSTAFYAELEGWNPATASSFVRETVIPLLDGDAVPVEVGAEALTDWLGERSHKAPTTIISDSGFDRWALAELLGSEILPANVRWQRVPIAYEAIDEAAQHLSLRRHHALDDARALRHLILEARSQAKTQGASA